MKKGVNINIQKKDLWLLSAIIVFLVGVGFVVAWDSNNPVLHGHTANEIEGISSSNFKSFQVVGDTNIVASSSWKDMEDMEITMNTYGGDILLIFSGNIEASGNTNVVGNLRFDLDGNSRHNMITEAGDGAWQNDFSMHWIEKDLPEGLHTFKVQWKGTNSNVQQDGTIYPRVFSVIELNGNSENIAGEYTNCYWDDTALRHVSGMWYEKTCPVGCVMSGLKTGEPSGADEYHYIYCCCK